MAVIVNQSYISWLYHIPYYGLISNQATYWEPPNVYDLAKQLSAIIAVYHATGWPVPNPYFPGMDFAYNILFYIPLAIICKSSKSINSFYPVFAIALIWVVWNVLSLIESSLETLKVDRKYYFLGVFFASFFAGFAALLVNSNYNDDYLLKVITKTSVRADDLFFSYIYVPQHLFAILCFIAAWMVINMDGVYAKRLFWQNLLLSCGGLCSYILAPVGLVIFSLFSLLNLSEAIKLKKVRWFIIATMFYLLTTFPFIYAAKKWAGGYSVLEFSMLSFHDGWQYFALDIGVLLVYLLSGMFLLVKNLKQKVYLSYLLLLIAVQPFLLFIHYPDSMLKTSLYLRIVMVPIACMGFVHLYTKLKDRHVLALYFVCIFPFLYSILLSFITINFFISMAFIPMSKEKRAIISVMRSMPENSYLYLPNHDSSLAALSGHLVYLNPYSVRPDGYLPSRDRADARLIVSNLESKNYDPNGIYIMSDSLTLAMLKSGDITPDAIKKVNT